MHEVEDTFKEPCSTCSSQCPAFQGGCSCSLPADRLRCLAFHLPPLEGLRLPAPIDERCCHPVVTASAPFPQSHRCSYQLMVFNHFFNISWHGAYLSRQEVDLCDSSGVFVQACKLHTRHPIAAGSQLRNRTTTQNTGDFATRLQLACGVEIKGTNNFQGCHTINNVYQHRFHYIYII